MQPSFCCAPMKVTPQEWNRVQDIFSKLSPAERHVFLGIRSREIRWLLAPVEAAQPQYRRVVYESRRTLEKIFSDHQLSETTSRELLARLLVLGKTQIFRSLNGVKDPVEVEEYMEHALNGSNGSESELVQTKLETMAVDLLDDSMMDGHHFPDQLTPFKSRYGITESEFSGLYHQSLTRDRFQRYEPFLSQGRKINSREQQEWQFFCNSSAMGVRADKKDGGQIRICEDNILLFEGDGFQVGAVFDGLGCADNYMNVLWQEVLKTEISKKFGKLRSPIDSLSLRQHLEKAIQTAQKKMKKIFCDLTPSVSFHRRDLPRLPQKKVDLFDRITANLKAQGLDVLEDLRWYALNSSALTTLEMILMTPEGKGYLCRVGDGQSLLLRKKSGQVAPIGTRKKNKDQSTGFLGVYHHLRSLEVIAFPFEKGDFILTMTDGPGDTYASTADVNHLGQIFLRRASLREGMVQFCMDVDRKRGRKEDDYALVALQSTSSL